VTTADITAARALQRIRARVAARYGMSVAEMRAAVLAWEEQDRGRGVMGRPMPPTVHGLRGGRACTGC